MTLAIEVSFFFCCIIGLLLHRLWEEKRHNLRQQEHYFWMAAAAELYLFDYDAKRDAVRLSEACAYLLQLPEIILHFSKADRQLKGAAAQEGLKKLRRAMKADRKDEGIAIQRPDGKQKYYRISCRRFCDEGDYRLSRIMGIFADVTADVLRERYLRQRANCDQLTGVYHRGAIPRLIEEELQESQDKETMDAFLMIDVDHFKIINDTCGHQTGDAILQGMAQILQQHVREEDYVGRMGGDEFCVFLKGVRTQEAVAHFGEIICGEVPERLSFGPEKEPVTISVGAAVSRAKDSFQAIYARADAVLYQAKQSGCNQFALAPLESGEEADP